MSNEPPLSAELPDENDSEIPPDSGVDDQFADVNLLKMGSLVEGGLVVFALALAYFFGFFEKTQPLTSIDAAQLQSGLIWGLVGTVPMLGYLAIYHFYSLRFLRPMQEFVDQHLRPLFQRATLVELVVISLMAGFCEELFFRWCLQGGITWLTGSFAAGLLVASLIFGLCHWVNSSYGITTTVIGIYLGLMMVWTGTWLAPAISHALFDLIALISIARFPAPVKSNAYSE